MEFPPQHFPLRWYQNFFASSRWLDPALLSLRVAPVVMVCATLLGTMAAIGIVRGNFRGRRVLEMFFVSPMAVLSASSSASLTPSIAMEQALDADLRDATSSRAPSPHPWTASSERRTPSDRYAGRDQIKMVGAIRSQHLDAFRWNPQAK